VKLLHKHDKLTQCCRAFTLALARLSCFSVCYLLRNGSTYGRKIWHVDAWRCSAILGLGLLSIGVIVGKKIKLY